MASGWLSWGSDPFAELVEKATSELLPPNHEDVALNLEICDQIRAKQVQPKHAAQTIKRRLGHANPNVVLLTLGLTDICIKNSGDHFLAEVGSAEFMENLVSILNAPTSPGKNVDVRNKLLRLIQSWAQVAEARPTQMLYVSKTYSDLKKRGFPFPPPDPSHVVSAALVDTLTAPEWIDGDVCLRCRTPFTTFTRKHHCRNCGNVFCHACSGNTMALPWFGVGQDVRVCDGCHANRGPPSNARRAKAAPPAPAKTDSSSLSRSATVGSSSTLKSSGRGGAGNAYAPQRSHTVTVSSSSRRKREEDEIALAIKLSLESGSGPSGGYVPSAPNRSSSSITNGNAAASHSQHARGPSGRINEGTDALGEDDSDLAAAIAASLRDYAAPQPSAPSGLSDVASIASTPATPAPQSERSAYDGGSYLSYAGSNVSYAHSTSQRDAPAAPPVPLSSIPIPPSIELPPQDVDSLLSFSQTVLRAEDAAAQTPNHPYAIQQLHQTVSHQSTQGLYERAQAARPKMARSLDEAGRRHHVLLGMHEKLSEAVRLYNRLLDAQMGRGPQILYSAGAGGSGGGAGQQPQQSHAAPPHLAQRNDLCSPYGQSPALAHAPVPSQPQPQPQSNGLYPSLPPGPPPTGSGTGLAYQHSGYGSIYPTQASTSVVPAQHNLDPTGAVQSPQTQYQPAQQYQQPRQQLGQQPYPEAVPNGHQYGYAPSPSAAAPTPAPQQYAAYNYAPGTPVQVHPQLHASAPSQVLQPQGQTTTPTQPVTGSGSSAPPPSVPYSYGGPQVTSPVQMEGNLLSSIQQTAGVGGPNAPSAPLITSEQQRQPLIGVAESTTSAPAVSTVVSSLASAPSAPSWTPSTSYTLLTSPSVAPGPSSLTSGLGTELAGTFGSLTINTPQQQPQQPAQELWRRESEPPLIDL